MSKILFILIFLGLSACDTWTTQDLLLRSTSKLALPLGPVHTPLGDSNTAIRVSLAFSRGPGNQVRTELGHSDNSSGRDGVSKSIGPSMLKPSSNQLSASLCMLSRIPGNGLVLRVGGGATGSSLGSSGWGEVGIAAGNPISIEGFMAGGLVSAESQADWRLETRDSDEGFMKSSVAQSTTTKTYRPFFRGGIHLATRNWGPWAEVQFTHFKVFDSPRGLGSWSLDMTTLGTGWAQPTPFGALVGYLRATSTGADWMNQVGLQWQGEISMP